MRRVLLHGFDDRVRDVDVPEPATPLALLRALSIRRDIVLVFADGNPVPDDAPLAAGAEVRIVRIVSGGATALRS